MTKHNFMNYDAKIWREPKSGEDWSPPWRCSAMPNNLLMDRFEVNLFPTEKLRTEQLLRKNIEPFIVHHF